MQAIVNAIIYATYFQHCFHTGFRVDEGNGPSAELGQKQFLGVVIE